MGERRFLSFLVVGSFFLADLGLATAEPAQNRASQLFDEALAADKAGDQQRHQELLRATIEADPDFELARWHLGQVFFRGYWRSLATIETIVSHDPRWKEYKQLREDSEDSVEDHIRLARWCSHERLEIEEQWHWRQVLRAVPDHPLALRSLGLKAYRGGYFTHSEIAEFKRLEKQSLLEFQRYLRDFKQLIKQAQSNERYSQEERLQVIADVRDPKAVEALYQTLLSVSPKGEKQAHESPQPSFDVVVGEAVVAALRNIRQHSSTLRLLDIAVFSPQAHLRYLAADALRAREPTSYMPLLMASLSAPLETNFDIDVLADGTVHLVEDIYTEGPEKLSHEINSVGYSTLRVERGTRQNSSPNFTELVQDTEADVSNAEFRMRRTKARVARENFSRAQQNARITQVLENITGQTIGEDPHSWWDAWKQYNEMYTPEELPVETTYNQEFYPTVTQPHECFVAGTPVWTQGGKTAIEKIEVGDLVLSQDPTSGELGYRPVIATTLRPPTKMMRISVGGEKITSTLGHRFWVAHRGWEMAKFLQVDQRLYAGLGLLQLESLEVVSEQPAHNLVVDGYHTYFVGNSRLLVHDSTCPSPTTVVLPGVDAVEQVGEGDSQFADVVR